MFSDASVILFTGGDYVFKGRLVSKERGLPQEGNLPPGGVCPPSVLTSSGSNCSGRYASYWNAFLLCQEI